MSDDLNEVRPGDRITADLINRLIRRVKAPPATGEGSVTVPALFGLALLTAKDLVLSQGLALGKVLDAFGRQLDPTEQSAQQQRVLSQVPTPGTRVNPGQTVQLTVSAQPTTSQPTPGPMIPDLMHKSLAEAQSRLAQLGIQSDQLHVLDVFGRPVPLTSSNKDDRFVIGQVPLAGSPASQALEVNLVTTEVVGPLMPDLMRLSLSNAKARLAQYNIPLSVLSALDVTGRPVDPNDSQNNDRVVISQAPPAGPQTKPISLVSVTTSVDAPSTGPTVPNLIHLNLATAKTRLESVGIQSNQVLAVDVFGKPVVLAQDGTRLVLNQVPPPGALVRDNLVVNLVATGIATTTTPPPDGGGGETPPPPTSIAPTISGFDPWPTPIESEVQIMGERFVSPPLANRVRIGGVDVAPSAASTTSKLYVVVPSTIQGGPPGPGDFKWVPVTVGTSAGQGSSEMQVTQQVEDPLPRITAIGPAATASPGSTITLYGVNFRPQYGSTSILIHEAFNPSNGIELKAVTWDLTPNFTVMLPPTFPGLGGNVTSMDVHVRIRQLNRNNTVALSPAYAYKLRLDSTAPNPGPAPSISSISGQRIEYDLIINGSNFAPHPLANKVTVGGVEVDAAVTSTPSRLNVFIPSNMANAPTPGNHGPVNVVVTTYSSPPATQQITVYNGGEERFPRIKSIWPTPAATLGQAVTINGTDFPSVSSIQVLILRNNSQIASIYGSVSNSSTITFTMPTQISGLGAATSIDVTIRLNTSGVDYFLAFPYTIKVPATPSN